MKPVGCPGKQVRYAGIDSDVYVCLPVKRLNIPGKLLIVVVVAGDNIADVYSTVANGSIASSGKYPDFSNTACFQVSQELENTQLIMKVIKELVKSEFCDTASNRIMRAAIMNLLWELETESK